MPTQTADDANLLDATPLRYRALSFRAPRGWLDASQFQLVSDHVPGGALIHVAMEPRSPTETLPLFTSRKLTELGKHANDLELVSSKADFVADRAAHTLRLRFMAPRGPSRKVEQILTLIDPGAERSVTLLSLVALAPSFDQVNKPWITWLKGVRFDAGTTSDCLGDGGGSARLKHRAMSFDALPGWRDTAVYWFNRSPPRAATMLVTFEPMSEGMTFRTVVDRKLAKLATHHEDFELIESVPTASIGGRAAHRIRFRLSLQNSEQMFEESMELVDGCGSSERTVSVFSMGAPGPSPALREAERTFAALLESVRFDEPKTSGELSTETFWPPTPSSLPIAQDHSGGATPVTNVARPRWRS